MPFSNNQLTALRSILTDKDTFATTMLVIAFDVYGNDIFEWSPPALLTEIQEDFNINLPGANFDRLMAAIYLVTNNSFYKSLPDFVELCNILSGGSTSFGQFEPADAADIAWGVSEALLISPQDEDEPFSSDIINYIEYILQDEGILVPPDILRLGMKNDSLVKQVQVNFSDDPELFNSIWSTENEKTDDINALIRERLTLLVKQLKSLPLQTGNTQDIAKRLFSNLNSMQRESDSII